MQPPTCVYVPLRVQLERLRKTAQHDLHTKPARHSERLREQIKAWSESMTPEQRKRRFTIEEIERLAGLMGKFGGRAAHHHIAQSLRAIEFAPRRDWTAAGRNKRYWIWNAK